MAKYNQISWTHDSFFDVEHLDDLYFGEQGIQTFFIWLNVRFGVIKIQVFWVREIDDNIIECSLDIGLNTYIFIRNITKIFEYVQRIELPSPCKCETRKDMSKKICSTWCQSFNTSDKSKQLKYRRFQSFIYHSYSRNEIFIWSGYSMKLLPVMIDINSQYFVDSRAWFKNYVMGEHPQCMYMRSSYIIISRNMLQRYHEEWQWIRLRVAEYLANPSILARFPSRRREEWEYAPAAVGHLFLRILCESILPLLESAWGKVG